MFVKLDLIYTAKQGLRSTYYFFQPNFKILIPLEKKIETTTARPHPKLHTNPVLLQILENQAILTYKQSGRLLKTNYDLGMGLALAQIFELPIFGSWEFIMDNGVEVSKQLIEEILLR